MDPRPGAVAQGRALRARAATRWPPMLRQQQLTHQPIVDGTPAGMACRGIDYATARLPSGRAGADLQRISTASSTDEMLKTQVRRVRSSSSRTKLEGLTSFN